MLEKENIENWNKLSWVVNKAARSYIIFPLDANHAGASEVGSRLDITLPTPELKL